MNVPDWRSYAESGHRSGSIGPIVTIVEFGDYQCPYCAAAIPHLDMVLRTFPQVGLVYRHYPLVGHRMAEPASRAAECAGNQGYFEPFHRLLYANRAWMTDESEEAFIPLAQEVGIPDVTTFGRCLREDPQATAAIQRDRDAARRLGVVGTPTFLINDRLYRGLLDSLQFQAIIEPLLTQNSRPRGNG
jgi:protein-disulfide isomerase